MRLYSVQLRILPRLIWGIGALVLATMNFIRRAPIRSAASSSH